MDSGEIVEYCGFFIFMDNIEMTTENKHVSYIVYCSEINYFNNIVRKFNSLSSLFRGWNVHMDFWKGCEITNQTFIRYHKSILHEKYFCSNVLPDWLRFL